MKRLQNAQDLRRYLASLINRVESGEVEVNLGKSLAYMSSILLRNAETPCPIRASRACFPSSRRHNPSMLSRE